jgi:hypothetical protein
MDVKTTFLHGELDEEIYMQQPDGFVVNGQERKVCKLLKSLSGLKQVPKQWHENFNTTLTSAGFVVNETDKCVYYRCRGTQQKTQISVQRARPGSLWRCIQGLI